MPCGAGSDFFLIEKLSPRRVTVFDFGIRAFPSSPVRPSPDALLFCGGYEFIPEIRMRQ